MSKRIFVSFAIEDEKLRDFLVGQSKNDKCPFEFYDMSVKTPWDSEWKTKCSTQKHFSKDILRKNEITEKQGGKFKWCDPKQRFFFFFKESP